LRPLLNTTSATSVIGLKKKGQPKNQQPHLSPPTTKSQPTFVALIAAVAIYLVRTNQTSVIDQEDDSAHKKKSALDKLFLSTCNKHPGTTRKKMNFLEKAKNPHKNFCSKTPARNFTVTVTHLA